jgi:hypothetical protein
VTVAGEDRRAARVREHLAAGGAAADLGVAWVVVEGPGVPPSALAGLDRVYSGPELTLYRNPAAVPAGHPTTARRAAMLLAYTLALGMVVGAAAWWST